MGLEWDSMGLPTGKHTKNYWKYTICSWFTHKKWWFSIVLLVYQRVPSGNIDGNVTGKTSLNILFNIEMEVVPSGKMSNIEHAHRYGDVQWCFHDKCLHHVISWRDIVEHHPSPDVSADPARTSSIQAPEASARPWPLGGSMKNSK